VWRGSGAWVLSSQFVAVAARSELRRELQDRECRPRWPAEANRSRWNVQTPQRSFEPNQNPAFDQGMRAALEQTARIAALLGAEVFRPQAQAVLHGARCAHSAGRRSGWPGIPGSGKIGFPVEAGAGGSGRPGAPPDQPRAGCGCGCRRLAWRRGRPACEPVFKQGPVAEARCCGRWGCAPVGVPGSRTRRSLVAFESARSWSAGSRAVVLAEQSAPRASPPHRFGACRRAAPGFGIEGRGCSFRRRHGQIQFCLPGWPGSYRSTSQKLVLQSLRRLAMWASDCPGHRATQVLASRVAGASKPSISQQRVAAPARASSGPSPAKGSRVEPGCS